MTIDKQTKQYGPRFYTENNHQYRITATVRHDDQCRNGRNSFSITADIDRKVGSGWREYSYGCCHEDVAKHFPELVPYIKWHLCSADEPMYYVANAKYWAGFGKYAARSPAFLRSTIIFGAIPAWDDGKVPEDMDVITLVEWLNARLPDLTLAFKRDVESLGLVF